MTAVEWLIEQMQTRLFTSQNAIEILEQAKEMEKQQIIEFTNDFIDKHTFGDYDGIVQKNKSLEEYYNEKFNK